MNNRVHFIKLPFPHSNILPGLTIPGPVAVLQQWKIEGIMIVLTYDYWIILSLFFSELYHKIMCLKDCVHFSVLVSRVALTVGVAVKFLTL